MKTVVFDTSFLVNSVKAKIDFLKSIQMEIGEFKTIISSPVLSELKFLAKRKTDANVALQILEQKGYDLVESDLPADLSITKIAEDLSAYVASTDWAVRRRSEKKGLKLITLRSGKRIEV